MRDEVWLLAILWGGAADLFRLIVSEGVSVISSPQQQAGLRYMMSRDYPAYADDMEALLVVMRPRLKLVKAPAGGTIETAAAAGQAALVTITRLPQAFRQVHHQTQEGYTV